VDLSKREGGKYKRGVHIKIKVPRRSGTQFQAEGNRYES
jgi:hypothetical protein